MANHGIPKSADDAMTIIGEVQGFYDNLISGQTTVDDNFFLPNGAKTAGAKTTGGAVVKTKKGGDSRDKPLSEVTDDE